jgi:ribosomal protein S27E
MKVKERIAYVRGLIEGSDFCGADTQARTIWENLLLICDELAETVEKLDTSQRETDEYVEAIDNDLADLESEIYGYDGDDDEDEDSAAADEHLVEMECPRCGEEVCFEEDFLYDADVEISCPACGGVVYATGTGADQAAPEAAPALAGDNSSSEQQ